MALGLNGFYRDGGAVWAHRAVDQAFENVTDQVDPVLALAMGRLDWITEKTEIMAALLEGRIGQAQSGLARLDAMSARQEAAMARMEAGRARMEAKLARMRVAPVMFNLAQFDPAIFDSRTSGPGVCPRVRVRVPRE